MTADPPQQRTTCYLAITIADRRLLLVTPFFCVAVLFFVLRKFASHDVRDAPQYLGFYIAMGAAWVGLHRVIFSFAGLSARDDVIERKNRAAGFAISGVGLPSRLGPPAQVGRGATRPGAEKGPEKGDPFAR